MRNSIRKIASLCLAMATILSVLAVPAFAEERVIHTCKYDNYVSSEFESDAEGYNNNKNHRYETVHYYACDCGEINPKSTYRYEPHLPKGSGTNPQYAIDNEGNVITLYTYICKICDEYFVSE